MFCFRAVVGAVELAFTDRFGGVSSGAWSSLNVGTRTGDDAERAHRNIELLAAEFGVERDRLVRMSQHHTRDVVVVDGSADMGRLVPAADSLVTAIPGVPLMARAADCVPVVLADVEAGVVGVVHSGREGTKLDICGAAVVAMRDAGATRLRAWLGPRACGRCYEVPETMRAEVTTAVPAAWSTTRAGSPALDLGRAVASQLAAAGVGVTDLADAASTCTIEDDRFFSYRRQGPRSGRLGALVRVRT
ncbi:MAG: laccase domain-containing protein [Nocardioidaceae bacterium]|nr:laccase domain-containing protein [Nocardioidaceae bacterium]